MARRGRKAKLNYNAGPGYQSLSKTDANKIARAIASFGRAGGRNKRGSGRPRKMGGREMALREAEAAALLGANAPKSRRGGFFSRFTRSARKVTRKVRRTMARGRKGQNSGQSYAQVTSQLPVQISIEVSEGLFSLASVGVDIYTAGTKSTADDAAFPIVARVLQSAARYGAQRFLSRKHPALAASIAHGMSAANGDRNGNFLRNQFRSLLDRAKNQGSGPPNP